VESHGKDLQMEIWTTFKAENENWNKTKASPCQFQESNLFRLKGVCATDDAFPSLVGD